MSCVHQPIILLSSENNYYGVYSFPLKNINMLKIWLRKMRRKNFTPNNHTYICSEHFLESDYLDRPGASIKRLKHDAYPSVFSKFPEYYQPPTKKNRTSVLDKLNRDVAAESVIVDSSSNLISDSEAVLLEVDPPPKVCNHVEVQTEISQVVETCSADKTRIRFLQKRIKVLNQKIRRQRRTICSLRDLVKDLKSKGLVENHTEKVLMSQFGGVAGVIFDNELANRFRDPRGRRYSQEMKKFALTLHYHSPQAYRYCRFVFWVYHFNITVSYDFYNPSRISNL